MSIPHFVVGVFYIASMFLGGGIVSCQDYPNKPIRIVTSLPGGSSDLVARFIAPGLTEIFGQPVIVENRGATPLRYEIVAKAVPDGYTLLHGTSGLWIGQLLGDTPYDAVKDFSPITLAVTQPNILVVHPSVAANSIKELIALAKAKPGALNYASGSTGGSTHLAGELFKSMAGVNIMRIRYKSSGTGLNGLLSGEVQMTFDGPATLGPHIKSGRLRALAVTSAEPTALVPGLPTVSASGLPGFESVAVAGIFAPSKTPAAIITRLNQEITRVLHRADVKEKFFHTGVEVVGSTPQQLAAAMKSDMVLMGKVIKDAGIKAD